MRGGRHAIWQRAAAANAMSTMSLAGFLARRRVSLGFVFAVGVRYFWRGRRWTSLAAGAAIGAAGEAIRVWAAGHLEKGREVTTSRAVPFHAASALSGLVDHGARRRRRVAISSSSFC